MSAWQNRMMAAILCFLGLSTSVSGQQDADRIDRSGYYVDAQYERIPSQQISLIVHSAANIIGTPHEVKVVDIDLGARIACQLMSGDGQVIATRTGTASSNEISFQFKLETAAAGTQPTPISQGLDVQKAACVTMHFTRLIRPSTGPTVNRLWTQGSIVTRN